MTEKPRPITGDFVVPRRRFYEAMANSPEFLVFAKLADRLLPTERKDSK